MVHLNTAFQVPVTFCVLMFLVYIYVCELNLVLLTEEATLTKYSRDFLGNPFHPYVVSGKYKIIQKT